MTRGYQTKQVDSRSFYIIPESECLVTVYFYSNGTNYLGLYTSDTAESAAVFQPEAGGDFAYTYHFTEVGSPLYIAGPIGDINLAGIAVAAAPTAGYDYEITAAEINSDGKLEISIEYSGGEEPGRAELIVAEYTGEDDSMLSNFERYDIEGASISGLDYTPGGGKIKIYIWDEAMRPLAEPVSV